MNFAQEVCKVTRFLVCCCCFVLPHRDKKHILKRILRTLRNVHRLMAFKLGAFQGIISMLLLLLLSCFSRVWLCAIPQTTAHQAPLSLGFSRQEDWSGLPFPSPMHESEKWKSSAQSYPTLSNHMDCSLPGSSAHGIFQARVLGWGAIAFSSMMLIDGNYCLHNYFILWSVFLTNMLGTWFSYHYIHI